MERYTQKYAEALFPLWLALIGGKSGKEPGDFTMDVQSGDPGVGIWRYTKSGGVIRIVSQMPPREFVDFVWNMESSLKAKSAAS